jgi:hypothetical protein
MSDIEKKKDQENAVEKTEKPQQYESVEKPDKDDIIIEPPDEIKQIIESLPPDKRKQVLSLIQFSSFSGPSRALLLEKFKDNHITQFLEQQEKHDAREFEYSKDSKKKNFCLMIMGIVSLVGLLVFFTLTLSKSNPSLYKDIVNLLIAAGLGFVGGFGLGKAQQSKS